LRQFRERERRKEEEAEERMRRALEEKNLKLEVLKEINDCSHLTIDGEEVAAFINRQKKFNEITKSMSVGDEL
jgi:hypothetical protein